MIMTTYRDARSASRPRRGFTLLEVLLSSAIGVLLMAALYVAVDVQLRHAQAGRDVVEQSTLARALLTRIASDIMPAVGPPLPSRSGSSASGAAQTGTVAAAGADPFAMPAVTGIIPFNIGVRGDALSLELSISRLPREMRWAQGTATLQGDAISDLRRVTYWLAMGTGVPLGLARYEVRDVTSDEAMEYSPIGTPEEATHILAEEVRSLSFLYFDGATWVDVWDGSLPGPDGMTPIGPPPLIAITVGIARPGVLPGADGLQNLKFYRHVVAIPTANGLTTQDLATGLVP
jgi:prepilin-type N-terminal cleavage/methylation domain-containing protein